MGNRVGPHCAPSPLHRMLQARIDRPLGTRGALTRPRFRAFIQGAGRVRLVGRLIDRLLGTFASGPLTRSTRKRDAPYPYIRPESTYCGHSGSRPQTSQVGRQAVVELRDREGQSSALSGYTRRKSAFWALSKLSHLSFVAAARERRLLLSGQPVTAGLFRRPKV